ncbi:MAG: PDZ domain-containing protein [Streptosporangiaceae bacterium]
MGDIIVDVNGDQIATEENITSVVGDARAGDVLTMKIIRDRRNLTLSLKLEKRPS